MQTIVKVVLILLNNNNFLKFFQKEDRILLVKFCLTLSLSVYRYIYLIYIIFFIHILSSSIHLSLSLSHTHTHTHTHQYYYHILREGKMPPSQSSLFLPCTSFLCRLNKVRIGHSWFAPPCDVDIPNYVYYLLRLSTKFYHC